MREFSRRETGEIGLSPEKGKGYATKIALSLKNKLNQEIRDNFVYIRTGRCREAEWDKMTLSVSFCPSVAGCEA
jgi:hypothetical protein